MTVYYNTVSNHLSMLDFMDGMRSKIAFSHSIQKYPV